MAQITITIPDPILPRILDAFAATYGWTAESGVTKAQFARQVIIRFVKEIVRAHEASRDAETARLAAVSKADTEIDIT